MIRGRRAHGAALATLPTCAHLSPDSQARLHRAGSVPCKPKTLKMSAYGTFSPYCATPKGLANTVGAAHTRVRHVAGGAGKNLLHPCRALGRLQPVKAKPLRGCFASLDRFPAPSASVSFATPRRWRGSRATKSCILPLTPWNRPNTHRRGRWIGFATCPCGLASEWGLGQSPKELVFVFEVVRVDVTVQKGQKNVHFRIFATKNTANLANF